MKNNSKKVVVIGASINPERYSNIAVKRLLKNNYEVIPIGIKKGKIHGIEILTEKPALNDIHTVTLYINPGRQPEYYDYIIKQNPKRIIFNPGAENPEFYRLALKNGIEPVEACTLVMLSTSTF